MTNATTVSASVQLQDYAAIAARLLPWWSEATEEQRQLVLHDMAQAHANGLEPEAYCQSPMPLAEHLANVQEHLAQQTTNPTLAPEQTTPPEQKPTEQQQRAEVDARAQKRVEGQAKDIAERWQKFDARQTTGLVDLGKRCDQYIRDALAAGYRRKNATDLLEQQILLATGESKDVNRAVQLYWACKLYGESFVRLPVTGQKSLAAFITRDAATEDWNFKPDYADDARKLYDRAVSERLTGDAIRAEANRIKDGSSTGTRAEKEP
jgi:hypothetical protein